MKNETFLKTNTFQALFLDRDGVINQRIKADYIKYSQDFFFLAGVLDAFSILARKFKYIFVVTNQQGVGKGRMTETDLAAVHAYMQAGIEAVGGRLDGIYYCPHLATAQCNCRKPNTGMALQAQLDFPELDFSQSVLLGDFPTDLLLAKKMGMSAVWLKTAEDLTEEQTAEAENLADDWANSLLEWTTSLFK